MKEKLKRLIIDKINSWDEDDIYAISLFYYNYSDNPCEPYTVLGYNTERQYQSKVPETPGPGNGPEKAWDAQEARWNYAFWLMNEELKFGVDDTAKDVEAWIKENGFVYFTYDEVFNSDITDDVDDEEFDKITDAFVQLLVDIVKEIHAERITEKKFGKKIPIIVHEFEVWDKIAKQNIEANGEDLDKDFIAFCCE